MVLNVLGQIFHPQMLALVLGGVLMGVILGAIPGLSGTIGIALLLPITFNMQPAQAILTLGGIFMGGMYGGSITAILINVPGDLCATCTAIEGYPMAKKGKALDALYYSIFSSMLGGLFGCAALCLFTPQLAKIALKFGPPEMFFCAMCGMAVVAALSGKNRWKAFFAAAFGVFIGLIGMDPITGVQRCSKTQDEVPFGEGNKEGIIAAESANNALVGGTMVPMLALGIPGSPTAAMIGSALTIHGLMCGPDLFNNSPDIAYVFMYGMIIATIMMALIGTFGVKWFSYILKVKMKYIVPIVLVFAMFGTYALNNSMFELIAAIVLGIIGAIFKRFNIPCAPVVIGVVLCDMIELNLRRSITLAGIYGHSLFVYVFTRPLAIFLAAIFLVMFIVFFSMGKDRKQQVKTQVEASMDE